MTRGLDRLTLGAAVLIALSAIASWAHAQARTTQAGAALNGVPVFEADPKWPVLPADWTWGQVIGIFADSRGHVWTSSRSRISEWDPQGKLAAVVGRARARRQLEHDPRHVRRSQRLRVDQRAREQPDGQVHAHRPGRDGHRQVQRDRRQQRHDADGTSVGDLGGSRGQRGLRRRRLRQPAHHRLRRRHRHAICATGARTASGRTIRRGATVARRRAAAPDARGAGAAAKPGGRQGRTRDGPRRTAAAVQRAARHRRLARRAHLSRRSRATIASRCSGRTASSCAERILRPRCGAAGEGDVDAEAAVRHRSGVLGRVLARRAADLSVRRRRRHRTSSRCSGAAIWRS